MASRQTIEEWAKTAREANNNPDLSRREILLTLPSTASVTLLPNRTIRVNGLLIFEDQRGLRDLLNYMHSLNKD